MASRIDGIFARERLSLGDLVDCADALSPQELFDAATTLSKRMCDDGADPQCLRGIVLLNAVLNRLVFERHGVPKSRDAPL